MIYKITYHKQTEGRGEYQTSRYILERDIKYIDSKPEQETGNPDEHIIQYKDTGGFQITFRKVCEIESV